MIRDARERENTMSRTGIVIVALGLLLSGCSSTWTPWGSSNQEQPRRLPDGAVEFDCAQGKKLIVRHAADGKSVWVMLPDREFRLDRIAASSAERYSNGPSTLGVESDGITLDVDGTRQFTDCKKKT